MSPVLVIAACLGAASPVAVESTQPFVLRGHALTLHLYGPATGRPVLLSSGDGGWVHLGPQAAVCLANAGYEVVGLDSREYLSAFTSGRSTLSEQDVRRDFATLVAFVARGRTAKPLLVGVSEGAGLSVLAATDAEVKAAVQGVIVLGLPAVNELAWRWKDVVIYVTKGVPDEPTFPVGPLMARVAPLPLAAIHSTHDEFAPLAVIRDLMARALPPSRLWVIEASSHAFDGNLREFERRLLEAAAWVVGNGA